MRSVAAEVLPREARKYLARYEQSCARYRDRFVKKGYPEKLVNSLVPELREEGFLDDRRFAREHVRQRIDNKSRGRHALVSELRERGVDSELAKQVVDQELDPGDERKMARRYCEDNQGLSRRKLASRLENRGFSGSLIRDMLEEFDEGKEV